MNPRTASSLVLPLFLLGLAFAQEFEYKSGSFPGCPANLSYISNVNLPRAQGTFYVQYLSFLTPDTACSQECWTIYYPYQGPRTLGVIFCCQREGYAFCGDSLGGGSLVDSACSPGQYTYTSMGLPLPAFILAGDYDPLNGYAIGLICGLFPDGTPVQAVYGYSRSWQKPDNYDEIFFGVLDRNGIDRSLAKPVVHGEWCNYNLGCGQYQTIGY